MARTTKKSSSKGSSKADAVEAAFDDEGVRLSILAALEAVYETFPHITLPQYLIMLEVRKAERDGAPHTLASLVKKLKMPFSTASRVVWSLTEDGGDVGVIRYLSHPTDRRKKQLVINQRNFAAAMPPVVARAMVAYYGDSVRSLKRVAA